MFREMRRKKQALSREECIEILKNEPRGVLSVLGDDDYPYGLPVDHYYNEDDGCIYFHGAKAGHKMDAIRKHDKVSICVYDKGYIKEGDWALNIKSVIVFGRISVLEDKEQMLDITRKLSHKYTDDDEYIESEIKSSFKAVAVFRIVPEHMSGKLVNES
jgi:nitroimidazol reductase NimA-like FMN-containing flavoprotein (pyridoxamine 5'-phosphate oxidase superfamily)